RVEGLLDLVDDHPDHTQGPAVEQEALHQLRSESELGVLVVEVPGSTREAVDRLDEALAQVLPRTLEELAEFFEAGLAGQVTGGRVRTPLEEVVVDVDSGQDTLVQQ